MPCVGLSVIPLIRSLLGKALYQDFTYGQHLAAVATDEKVHLIAYSRKDDIRYIFTFDLILKCFLQKATELLVVLPSIEGEDMTIDDLREG